LKDLPSDILHDYDKIYTDVFADSDEASDKIANKVIKAIVSFQPSPQTPLFRLGLTTGSTPQSLYRILSDYCRKGKLSFRNVAIYSIDEYYPTISSAKQSRNRKLHEELLDNIDILPENIHIPDGSIPKDEVPGYCFEFDRAARNLDLLVIGVGEKGQVGFNEAGVSEQSWTRTVLLPYQSRKRQAKYFNGDLDVTPKMAITMGISTMMSAKKIYLMAWGEEKADIVAKAVEGTVDPACPVTYFQRHQNIHVFVDEAAGAKLTREVAPWLIGPCEWTPKFQRMAVIWLSQKVHKPILKLTLQDYLQNSLNELVEQFGPYDKINIQIFNDLQHTITGWPGGKPNADDSTRPVASSPYPKNVLIFSPHPDDDVISMGGTFIRLTHQGHNVHVAYETSGDLAVHDDVVLQHMDAAHELGFGDRFDEVKAIISSKKPGEAEPKELLSIKAAIRRSEARGADRSFGLPMENVHFLNLPFYESGGVAKLPRTQVDVDIIKEMMQKVRPHQIYMAGDLADPHGTHRVCTEAAMEEGKGLTTFGKCGVGKSFLSRIVAKVILKEGYKMFIMGDAIRGKVR